MKNNRLLIINRRIFELQTSFLWHIAFMCFGISNSQTITCCKSKKQKITLACLDICFPGLLSTKHLSKNDILIMNKLLSTIVADKTPAVMPLQEIPIQTPHTNNDLMLSTHQIIQPTIFLTEIKENPHAPRVSDNATDAAQKKIN